MILPQIKKKDHFQALATGVPKLKTWLGTQRVNIVLHATSSFTYVSVIYGANFSFKVNPLPSKVLYTKKLHFSIGRLAQKQKTFSMCKLSVFESKLTKESKF